MASIDIHGKWWIMSVIRDRYPKVLNYIPIICSSQSIAQASKTLKKCDVGMGAAEVVEDWSSTTPHHRKLLAGMPRCSHQANGVKGLFPAVIISNTQARLNKLLDYLPSRFRSAALSRCNKKFLKSLHTPRGSFGNRCTSECLGLEASSR